MAAPIRHPQLHDPEFLRLRLQEGMIVNEIALLLGTSHRHVQNALRRFKISYTLGHSARSRAAMSRAKKLSMRGAGNTRWKGGRRLRGGYVLVYKPEHPRAERGYVAEHRLVAERTLGRPLLSSEVVHHHNRVKHDNRPENLIVFPSHAEHQKRHAQENKDKKSNRKGLKRKRKRI